MDAKRWLKAAAAKTVGQWVAANAANSVAVICYHSIHPDKSISSATPDLFERHLRWLSENCKVVRFSRILDTFLVAERNRPTVAITFDDGNADNYEHAFPLLQKYEMPSTFFLTAGLLERSREVVERFRMLRKNSCQDIPPLTWSQVLEMRRCGMEIGAHTFSHPNLARLDRKDVELELKRSKEIIEQHLGEAVTLMAYPFGKPGRNFQSETVEIVAESGYEYAASILCKRVEPGCPRLSVPRFIVLQDSLDSLSDKIHGAWDLVGLWQEKAPLWMARIVSPRDFSV